MADVLGFVGGIVVFAVIFKQSGSCLFSLIGSVVGAVLIGIFIALFGWGGVLIGVLTALALWWLTWHM